MAFSTDMEAIADLGLRAEAGLQLQPRQSYLEKIPAELRLQIYRELLISSDAIDIDWERPKGLYPNIMRTCKAIFRESHPVLYDENTFKVRIGIPQHLGAVVPIVPPLREDTDEICRLDEKASWRCFSGSYLNDVFPQFLGLHGNGLWRNRAFCDPFTSSRRRHNFEDEKLPRRLLITIECGDISERLVRHDLDILAKRLQNIPLVYSVAISCENTPPGFWTTGIGIVLGNMLCTYLGGCVRRIHTVTTYNISEVYANVLLHDLTSSNPKRDNLLLVCRALMEYLQGLDMHGTTADGKMAEWPGRGELAYRAMERGDWKAFQHHREQEMRWAEGITCRWYSAKDVYKHDPVGDDCPGPPL